MIKERKDMKKILTAAFFFFIVLLIGCVPADLEADSPPEMLAPVKEALEPMEELVQEAVLDCTNRYEEEQFLVPNRSMYFHDWWIFYNRGGDFRKCRPELTEDSLVFSHGWNYALNHDGYATMKVYPSESRRSGDDEIHILDVHSGKSEKIYNLDTMHMTSAMLYKDYLIVCQGFVIDGYGGASRLDLYDRKGNFIKTFATEIDYLGFAVIDDAVYYLPYFGDAERTMPPNKIMRYDIISGETEEFFSFDLAETPLWSWNTMYCWPSAYFNGRTILIFNGKDYIYTSIDKINSQKIVFDKTSKEYLVDFIPSTDKDLFFIGRKYGENISDPTLYIDFFRVENGMETPILLKEFNFPYGNDACFSDGYLYYFNNDGVLMREQFYEKS